MSLGIRCLLVITFLLCCLLSGCGEPSNNTAQLTNEPVMPNESTEAFTQAADLFVKSKCISCHGTDLRGRVGEATNLQKVGARRTIDEIASQIRHGGNGMPGYGSKLDDAQIQALADWLHSKK